MFSYCFVGVEGLSAEVGRADYGGIKVLRLPPDKVWKPDIVLFNNADGNYEVRYKSNVLIYPHGEVLWVPPAIYQIREKIATFDLRLVWYGVYVLDAACSINHFEEARE
ncbi:hypothetical protein Pmani_013881 [Petrolisthes manimaculis]|uniref:Neurotransmitter-gated ion-channel ligand-binding domain-containing protein n=1 Tax=Petrolisthes manimaculis TaxID=1843537 RepID=A0AAE1PU72_9EUCA|nr:hypothetical protein Pmani_013881 [Petrolisthes manimaculis]